MLLKLMKPSSFLPHKIPTPILAMRSSGLTSALQRLSCTCDALRYPRSARVPHLLISNDRKSIGLNPVSSSPTSVQRRQFHWTIRKNSADDTWPAFTRSGDLLTWKFKLQNPFGEVTIKTDRSVRVGPIDVLAHPGGDYAAFHLTGDGLESEVNRNIALDYDGERSRLSLVDVGRGTPTDERWVLEIPPYYDLDVVHYGDQSGVVDIHSLENSVVTATATGDIHVHKVKSRDVTLQSTNGAIISTSVLQGNVKIRTEGDKGFTADRLQGSTFDVHTDNGDVQCKDLYGGTSVFKSRSGTIHLGNLTGECSVSTHGDVSIENLDGAVEAEVCGAGSFTGYLVRPERVSIKTEKGDISVSFPSDVKCDLDLSACDITLPAHMNMEVKERDGLLRTEGALNGGGPPVKASSTEGSIFISVKSWFDSLKLTGR